MNTPHAPTSALAERLDRWRTICIRMLRLLSWVHHTQRAIQHFPLGTLRQCLTKLVPCVKTEQLTTESVPFRVLRGEAMLEPSHSSNMAHAVDCRHPDTAIKARSNKSSQASGGRVWNAAKDGEGHLGRREPAGETMSCRLDATDSHRGQTYQSIPASYRTWALSL
eukprot:5580940-Amphidinium_carterae.1